MIKMSILYDKEIRKERFDVRMDGDQFLKYEQWRLSRRKNKVVSRQVMGFSLAVIGLIFLMIMVMTPDLFKDHSPEPSNAEKTMMYQHLSELSWSQVGKLFVIIYGFWIAVAVGVAWIIHGTGFYIIRR